MTASLVHVQYNGEHTVYRILYANLIDRMMCTVHWLLEQVMQLREFDPMF